jgi:hypothetical protein
MKIICQKVTDISEEHTASIFRWNPGRVNDNVSFSEMNHHLTSRALSRNSGLDVSCRKLFLFANQIYKVVINEKKNILHNEGLRSLHRLHIVRTEQ